MTAKNFDAAMEELMISEGGYVNHPKDPGGETNFGISKRSYPYLDIKKLTLADAKKIYRRSYWDAVKADNLPSGVDLAVFDPAVNSGNKQAVKWLQQVLSVTADGTIGAKTLAAASAADPVATIQKICALRMGFMRGLRTWTTFGRGWSTRVARVEAKSVSMASGSGVVLVTQQKAATQKAHAAMGNTAGTSIGSVSGISLADLPVWEAWVILALALGACIYFLGVRRHETNRAKAYKQEIEHA